MSSDANTRFLLAYIELNLPPGGRLLDFGCGEGTIVRSARSAGHEAYGADVFYGGGDVLEEPEVQKMLGAGVLRRISSAGVLPFNDHSIDLAVADQVFEHVEDLDQAVAELARVLKPDGRLYLMFPSLESWREVHIGIPFAHRLPRGATRVTWTRALRAVGMGKFKHEQGTQREWVAAKLNWIDTYTHYRPRREIEALLVEHGFHLRPRELEYVRFRASSHRCLSRLLAVNRLGWLWQLAFRRVGSVCLEADLSGPSASWPSAATSS